MADPAVSAYTDPRATSLNAHLVRQISDNVKMKVDEGRNLVNCVDADLSDDGVGVGFTSNDVQDVEFGVLARADRYTKPQGEILKVGQRQANYFEPFIQIEHSSSDKFERMVDPANSMNNTVARAHNLYRDQTIMNNLFADMLEAVDEDPEVANFGVLHKLQTVSFPAGQIIPQNYDGYYHGKATGDAAPASPDQGFNKQKMLGGRDKLIKHVRDGRLICALTEKDILNLATEIQLTNADYVDQKLLVEIDRIISNEIDMALGITFKVLRPAAQVGFDTNAAQVGMWYENAIEFKEREIVPLDIVQLPERHYNHQLYQRLRMGCLRNSDADVVQILVNHTNTPIP